MTHVMHSKGFEPSSYGLKVRYSAIVLRVLIMFLFVYHICQISLKSSPLIFIFLNWKCPIRTAPHASYACMLPLQHTLNIFYADKGIRTLKILFLKQACIPFHHIHLTGAEGLEPTMKIFFSGFGDQCLTIRLYPYIVHAEGLEPSC